MKIKLLICLLSAFLLPVIILGQSETYTISLAKFSSEKYDEFSPVYFKNGLVFCSNRNQNFMSNYQTPDNKGLFKINYIENIAQGNSGKVKLLSKNLTTRFNDGPASFSKNGDTIYFSRNLKVDGPISENSNPRNKLGIFTAVLEGNVWVKIADLRFNNEYYNITTPFISPDGKRLFFASDNPEGRGGSDLYFSQWGGGFWGDPVNLGPDINTSGNESYPFADSEGALYFSSDGHPGSGGKDIFYTKQSGNKWLPPVHLDAPINSEFDDFALVADSVMNGGYFSSKRGGTIDIYSFKTNIRQLYYCNIEKVNQYCFRFTDKGKIPIDDRYLDLEWSFGDGAKLKGQNVEHCFPGPGRYTVKLEAIDKKSGEVFFSKLSYLLELKDIEQPVINSPASAIVGQPLNFDGLASHFPGSEILNYTWYFGDGERTTGEKVTHTFLRKGDFEVKLGLTVRNKNTGIIRNACVYQPVKVLSDQLEKTTFDKRVVGAAPLINVFDYDLAKFEGLYSAEEQYNQDIVFHLEVLSSKIRLAPDDKVFAKIPVKYTMREVFIPGEYSYSYVIDVENSLMAIYPSFNEIRSLGYKSARVRTFALEDPAAKELNNMKRVFGVSADTFFGKNDFILNSSGTQLLDLVLGFMVKYPEIKLQIETHTDNLGVAATNLQLSQRRSQAMVNYLVSNGVSSSRLVPKGFGGTRPVAPNYLEADRKINRRIDFVILK